MSKPPRERRVIITRSREGNTDLAERLSGMGFVPVSVNTVKFLPPEDWKEVDLRLTGLASYDWLLFTSATGVRFFLGRMSELGLRTSWNGKPLVSAVGEKTAKALHNADLHVRFVPSSYLTSTLGMELPSEAGRSVLLLRADIADPELAKILAERGFDVDQVAIYTTHFLEGQVDWSQLSSAEMVIFGSPSAVRGFTERLPAGVFNKLRGVTAACIGPVTAQAARRVGFRNLIVSSQHTYDALLSKIGRMS